MTQAVEHGNGSVAQLANVGLCFQALERAMERPDHLPGMVTFYGPSGYGKSTAAAYTANKCRAYYVECKSVWTRKALLLALCNAMGLAPGRTLSVIYEQIVEQLALSGRPVIIDELDHVVDKKAVEVVRDIYEGSGAAMLLIGEENLPSKLKRWERFHGRMLDWVPAQPATAADAGHLARLYSTDVEIADDLLERIATMGKGSVRRICVNIERVRQEALSLGQTRIDKAGWGTRNLFTGDAPPRRLPV